ncbi:MAG: ABC transporter ATP-binding protein [Spirochaetota bacterium]
MAEVKLENVGKLYGRKRAVKDVSFTCREGEFFSIIGPTGAGKTTILKMIAGIEPVTSGNIYFNNTVVNKLSPPERNVSMAFETYNLYPHFSVYENIAFPLRAPKWGMQLTPEQEHKRVREIADFLGIGELLDRLPQYLSGGQKQRVSLARALVRSPEVYLLDEPIAHLDARLKFSTQTLLKEFAIEYRSTIIYVTHDFREALALSDRMAVLRKGTIQQIAVPEKVYNNPATDFVGRIIGEPPMNLIDTQVISRNGITLLKAGEDFTIQAENKLLDSIQNASWEENGMTKTRIGIRAEHVKMSRQKISDNSFQLPVYAIVAGAESSIATFELEDTFLNAMTVGFCDYKENENVWVELDQDYMLFYKKTFDISKR